MFDLLSLFMCLWCLFIMSLSVLDRCDRSVQSQQIPLGVQDVFFVVVVLGGVFSFGQNFGVVCV